jgi:hypothetical protein
MKLALLNRPQITKAFEYILQEFDKGLIKGANFILEPFIKDKTKEQLGFFFGGLVDAVQSQKGLDKTQIKIMFYKAVSKLDDHFRIEFMNIDGEYETTYKTLSMMKCDDVSLFIDRCLFLIDNSKILSDVILHPSLRYSWINNISKYDLKDLNHNVPERDNEYLSFVRGESCSCCGIYGRSEPHHLRIDNLGGMGIKPSDVYTLPICHNCHMGIAHNQGNDKLLENYKWITTRMTMQEFCLIKYNRWKNK